MKVKIYITMMSLVKNNILLTLYFVMSILYAYYRLFLDIDELLFFRSSALILLFLNYAFKVKKVDFLFLIVLLLEFIAGYVFLLNDNGFVQGLAIFLIINLLLTVIITKRIGIIDKEDVTKIASIFGATLLVAVYFIFKSAGHIRLLLVVFGVVFSMVLSCSYLDYKKNKGVFSIWFLVGVVLFLVRYILAGYTRLLESNNALNILEALSYIIGIFCFTKAMISTNEKEPIKSSAQSHS